MDWLSDAPAAPVRRRSTASATCCRTSPSCAASRTAASRSSPASAGRSPARPACSSTRSIRPAATSSRSPTPTSASWSRATAPAGRSTRTRRSSTRSYHSFYESTLALYRDQYPIFGDPEVLPVKVIWDYTYYWGVLAQFFFQRRLADLASLSVLRAELAHCQALNLEVQALLRAWSASRPGATVDNPAVMLDQADAAVVRRAQPQPARPPRRRRLPRAHPLLDAADAVARRGDRARRANGSVEAGALRRLSPKELRSATVPLRRRCCLNDRSCVLRRRASGGCVGQLQSSSQTIDRTVGTR